MKHLKRFFKNLSFRRKIALISLGISLIPVLLLGSFSYSQTRHLLLERENTALKESLEQEVKNLDYKMDSYLAAMNLITWNENMRSSLSKTYNNNFDMYLIYRDVIDPLFLTIRSLHSTIDSITVYTDNPIHPHGDILQPLSEISEEAWYEYAYGNTTPFFTLSADGNTLLLICQMYYQHSSYTNIVCMSIDANTLFRPLKELFDQAYGIILFDHEGNTVFQYTDFTGSKHDYASILEELKSNSPNVSDTSDYVVKKATLSSVDWEAYLFRPVETIAASVNQIAVIVILIILLCLFIILLSCIILSKVVVRPLEALAKNMQLIEQGDLSINVKKTSSDEIGHLIQAFSQMVERLKHLIDEVLKSKIKQQEYEMKALQAQINPHFLYNSLSLINGKALLAGQNDISQMALLLSTFYRTTLNKGKSFTTVNDELKNTLSYAQIQNIMHSNSFDIVYDIDENLFSYPIPNLLLQPLVENAIIHGIDHKETLDKGILTISCYQEDSLLIFKVLDNGCGMSEEQCRNILISESSGYGIQNVHHRVQLYYGSEYGLHYNSTKGVGTCATLTLTTVLQPQEFFEQ